MADMVMWGKVLDRKHNATRHEVVDLLAPGLAATAGRHDIVAAAKRQVHVSPEKTPNGQLVASCFRLVFVLFKELTCIVLGLYTFWRFLGGPFQCYINSLGLVFSGSEEN